MPNDVLIIGGGFAGLAAGVALAEAGKRVCLLEQKPHLGGRARSFRDPTTGSVVDNGQHLFMGCYHSTIQFLKTLGTLDRLHFQPRLAVPFLDRDGRLYAPRLPGLAFTLASAFGCAALGEFLVQAETGSVAFGKGPARRREELRPCCRRERYGVARPAGTIGRPPAQFLGLALHRGDE